jgi:hypothetical protein
MIRQIFKLNSSANPKHFNLAATNMLTHLNKFDFNMNNNKEWEKKLG